MNPLTLAWLDLCRRPLSTVIALVAISLSVAGSGLLLRVNRLAQDRIARLASAGDALIGAKAGGLEMILGALGGEGPFPEFLPSKLFETLRAEQTVNFSDGTRDKPSYLRGLYPLVFFGQLGTARAVGTSADFFARPDKPILFYEGHAFSGRRELVLGAHVGPNEGWTPGARVLLRPWAGELSAELVEFTVVGRLAETHSAWDDLVFAGVADAQSVLETVNLNERSIWGAGVLHYFLADLHPGGFPHLASLINRRTVAEAVEIAPTKERLRELTGTGAALGRGLTALVLGLAALAVATLLTTRFEALALQLAVLRAIGYSRLNLAIWLLGEGLMLGLVSIFVGASLDGLLFPGLRSLLGRALPAPDLVQSSLLISAPVWLGALGAVLVSIIVPLVRVYRQDVATALRS